MMNRRLGLGTGLGLGVTGGGPPTSSDGAENHRRTSLSSNGSNFDNDHSVSDRDCQNISLNNDGNDASRSLNDISSIANVSNNQAPSLNFTPKGGLGLGNRLTSSQQQQQNFSQHQNLSQGLPNLSQSQQQSQQSQGYNNYGSQQQSQCNPHNITSLNHILNQAVASQPIQNQINSNNMNQYEGTVNTASSQVYIKAEIPNTLNDAYVPRYVPVSQAPLQMPQQNRLGLGLGITSVHQPNQIQNQQQNQLQNQVNQNQQNKSGPTSLSSSVAGSQRDNSMIDIKQEPVNSQKLPEGCPQDQVQVTHLDSVGNKKNHSPELISIVSSSPNGQQQPVSNENSKDQVQDNSPDELQPQKVNQVPPLAQAAYTSADIVIQQKEVSHFVPDNINDNMILGHIENDVVIDPFETQAYDPASNGGGNGSGGHGTEHIINSDAGPAAAKPITNKFVINNNTANRLSLSNSLSHSSQNFIDEFETQANVEADYSELNRLSNLSQNLNHNNMNGMMMGNGNLNLNQVSNTLSTQVWQGGHLAHNSNSNNNIPNTGTDSQFGLGPQVQNFGQNTNMNTTQSLKQNFPFGPGGFMQQTQMQNLNTTQQQYQQKNTSEDSDPEFQSSNSPNSILNDNNFDPMMFETQAYVEEDINDFMGDQGKRYDMNDINNSQMSTSNLNSSDPMAQKNLNDMNQKLNISSSTQAEFDQLGFNTQMNPNDVFDTQQEFFGFENPQYKKNCVTNESSGPVIKADGNAANSVNDLNTAQNLNDDKNLDDNQHHDPDKFDNDQMLDHDVDLNFPQTQVDPVLQSKYLVHFLGPSRKNLTVIQEEGESDLQSTNVTNGNVTANGNIITTGANFGQSNLNFDHDLATNITKNAAVGDAAVNLNSDCVNKNKISQITNLKIQLQLSVLHDHVKNQLLTRQPLETIWRENQLESLSIDELVSQCESGKKRLWKKQKGHDYIINKKIEAAEKNLKINDIKTSESDTEMKTGSIKVKGLLQSKFMLAKQKEIQQQFQQLESENSLTKISSSNGVYNPRILSVDDSYGAQILSSPINMGRIQQAQQGSESEIAKTKAFYFGRHYTTGIKNMIEEDEKRILESQQTNINIGKSMSLKNTSKRKSLNNSSFIGDNQNTTSTVASYADLINSLSSASHYMPKFLLTFGCHKHLKSKTLQQLERNLGARFLNVQSHSGININNSSLSQVSQPTQLSTISTGYGGLSDLNNNSSQQLCQSQYGTNSELITVSPTVTLKQLEEATHLIVPDTFSRSDPYPQECRVFAAVCLYCNTVSVTNKTVSITKKSNCTNNNMITILPIRYLETCLERNRWLPVDQKLFPIPLLVSQLWLRSGGHSFDAINQQNSQSGVQQPDEVQQEEGQYQQDTNLNQNDNVKQYNTIDGVYIFNTIYPNNSTGFSVQQGGPDVANHKDNVNENSSSKSSSISSSSDKDNDNFTPVLNPLAYESMIQAAGTKFRRTMPKVEWQKGSDYMFRRETDFLAIGNGEQEQYQTVMALEDVKQDDQDDDDLLADHNTNVNLNKYQSSINKGGGFGNFKTTTNTIQTPVSKLKSTGTLTNNHAMIGSNNRQIVQQSLQEFDPRPDAGTSITNVNNKRNNINNSQPLFSQVFPPFSGDRDSQKSLKAIIDLNEGMGDDDLGNLHETVASGHKMKRRKKDQQVQDNNVNNNDPGLVKGQKSSEVTTLKLNLDLNLNDNIDLNIPNANGNTTAAGQRTPAINKRTRVNKTLPRPTQFLWIGCYKDYRIFVDGFCKQFKISMHVLLELMKKGCESQEIINRSNKIQKSDSTNLQPLSNLNLISKSNYKNFNTTDNLMNYQGNNTIGNLNDIESIDNVNIDQYHLDFQLLDSFLKQLPDIYSERLLWDMAFFGGIPWNKLLDKHRRCKMKFAKDFVEEQLQKQKQAGVSGSSRAGTPGRIRKTPMKANSVAGTPMIVAREKVNQFEDVR